MMDVAAKVMEQIVIQPSGCWDWTGGKTIGYGRVYVSYRPLVQPMTHRVMYEHFRGPIPAGLTIDHLCRNRACCNPGHLEVVTIGENTLRGEGPTAVNARRTRCLSGHLFDTENTYTTPDGRRQCRLCGQKRNEQWRRRK